MRTTALPILLLLAIPDARAAPTDDPSDAVRRYYAAIGRRDFRAAYAAWDAGSGRGYPAFARGFAATRSVRVAVAPATDVEGAAGSVYATVRVDVRAELKDGRAQRFAGSYTLRRNNTGPEMAGWRLYHASLHRVR